MKGTITASHAALDLVGHPRGAILAIAVVAAGGLGGTSQAGQKTLVVGAGDCKDSVVLGTVREFQELSRGLLRGELIEHEDALAIVRPQPTRSLEDLARQVETARSLLFNSQNERAAEVVNDALASLEQVSPQVGPWSTIANALMLSAQLHKNLDHPKGSSDAFRRILRVDPTYRANPDDWPPSTIRALDTVRRELQRSKKGLLHVTSLGGSAASVFLDGREVGKTPLNLELPQGKYRLSLLLRDTVSFPRVVSLGREESVQVDMAFEGSLAPQLPLCLNGDDSGAVKLATAVGASRVVVLRNSAQDGNPPYVTGVLYEVDRGDRVRNAGIRPKQLRDLMMYLFTGQPDISKEPPPMADASAPAMPPLVEVGASEARGSPVRPLGYAALGVGGAAAVAGVIVFATAPTVRKGPNGYVLAEDVTKVPAAQLQQGLGVGFMVGGVAVAVAGGLAALLAPKEEPSLRTSLVPIPGGAVVVFGGRLQ